MPISASARQRVTSGIWGGRKAGSFAGREEVVATAAATPTAGGKGRGKNPQARIYLRDAEDKRDVAELIKAKLRERYPERVVPEHKPTVDDAESIAEIAARNAEIERQTEISRIERQKSDDADILALIMLGMQ